MVSETVSVTTSLFDLIFLRSFDDFHTLSPKQNLQNPLEKCNIALNPYTKSTAQKIIQKTSQNDSKIVPKSVASATPFTTDLLRKRLKNRMFMNFSSKMGPKMDPKINQKSIPRPPGLSEGPPNGPRTLRDPILERFLKDIE